MPIAFGGIVWYNNRQDKVRPDTRQARKEKRIMTKNYVLEIRVNVYKLSIEREYNNLITGKKGYTFNGCNDNLMGHKECILAEFEKQLNNKE